MAVYLTTLAVALMLGFIMKPNRSRTYRRIYIIITFGIIILLSALRKYTVGKDLAAHYYTTYLRVNNLPWQTAFESTSYEKGFVAFLKAVGSIFDNPQWMIAINAVFLFGVIGWFIYKNSEDVVMSVFLFIACNTWFMDLNIMRQGMAISTGLIAMEFLKHKEMRTKRYLWYILCVLVAASFHSTGIILLIIPLVEKLPFKRNHVLLSAVFLVAAFFMYDYLYELTSSVISLTRDYAEYYETKNYGAGSISAFALYELFVPLSCFILACSSLVYKKKSAVKASGLPVSAAGNETAYKDSFLLYLVLFLVMCRLLRMRIYIITRMAYYFIPFMWILFPRAVKAVQGANNRLIIKLIMYSVMLAVFIYIGFNNAAEYYGTVPYSFFWE